MSATTFTPRAVARFAAGSATAVHQRGLRVGLADPAAAPIYPSMQISTRIGWKVCPAASGKFAVAGVYGGDVVGNAIIVVDTAEEAKRIIDSGVADDMEANARRPRRTVERAR